jgi:hypothetical protein
MARNLLNFPKQKLPIGKKDTKWGETCIDSALTYTQLYDSSRRSPKYRKLRNYNLYNGKFDKEDLAYVCNPLGMEGYEFPANMQYYPIATPIFDLLFGEESKRPFSFLVKSINPEAITEKEKQLKEELIQVLKQKLMANIQPEEGQEAPPEPEEVINYYKYTYQDMRESTATKIVQYLKRSLELKEKFQYSWEDALLAGEEIFKIDIVANEPVVTRCNPIEVTAILPHNQYILDEAEVIIEETWMSVSEVVDMFYDELTPQQIDELEDTDSSREEMFSNTIFPERSFLSDEPSAPTYDYAFYDSDGNVRVNFVTWKSKKKVGELTYVDEYGIEQSTVVDESYRKQPGERIKWFWINEYWEGVKVGANIYLKVQPKKVQFRRMDNISACKSGYVGTVYNANNSQSVSLMDRLVPWIYLYIVMWYRTELLIAANQGKIALIDLALIPDGWEIEKWMYYATAMKFGFVNSFNESKKGASQGKLANNSTQNKSLDLETGQAINGHVQLLEFIENKIKELSGVTNQRMGAISASETVGNTKRAVVQSSHITEKWFELHNYTKKRVIETLIEAAKEAWKGQSKKLQYITDDMASIFFTVDGNDFINSEYGVFVSNSDKDREALEALKELTHAAMQNDRIMLSSIADIYTSESLSDVKAKLMKVEEEMQARQEQMQQSQQQADLEKTQLENQIKQAEIEKDYYKIDQDNATKLAVAEINSFRNQMDQDINNNNVPDQLEIEKLKAQVNFNARKLDIEEKKLKQKEEKDKEELKIKRQQKNNK